MSAFGTYPHLLLTPTIPLPTGSGIVGVICVKEEAPAAAESSVEKEVSA